MLQNNSEQRFQGAEKRIQELENKLW